MRQVESQNTESGKKKNNTKASKEEVDLAWRSDNADCKFKFKFEQKAEIICVNQSK